MTYNHPFIEKYNPGNFQPEVYDFLADFSDEELAQLHNLDWQNPEYYEQNLITLTKTVSGKYSRKKRRKGELSLDPEAIGESGRINCYGACLALSQVMNYLSLDHKIAFANNHSFVLTRNNDQLLIANAYYPDISGEIDKENICHESCVDRGFFAANMFKHSKSKIKIINEEAFLRENQWVRFSKNQNRFGSGHREDLEPMSNNFIYVRTFTPSAGARTLYAYDQYMANVERKKYSQAYFLSKVLVDIYPEMDIRNYVEPAENLAIGLDHLGLSTLASLVIDRTAQGRQVAETIAPQIWRADQYRKLFIISNDPAYKQQAQAALEALLLRDNLSPQQKALIEGKLSKLNQLPLGSSS